MDTKKSILAKLLRFTLKFARSTLHFLNATTCASFLSGVLDLPDGLLRVFPFVEPSSCNNLSISSKNNGKDFRTVLKLILVTQKTINIRSFLKEIEQDASLLDAKLQSESTANSQRENASYFWFRENQILDVLQENPSQINNEQDTNASKDSPRIMTNQDIASKYWSISLNIRMISVKLQRWMSTIMGLVSAWTAIRLAHWLSHTPTWYGVLMLIMPLILIPLLTSSYAEVNYEGGKVIQSIFPTEARVPMFRYLYGQPMQMTVYSHAITYGTIGEDK